MAVSQICSPVVPFADTAHIEYHWAAQLRFAIAGRPVRRFAASLECSDWICSQVIQHQHAVPCSQTGDDSSKTLQAHQVSTLWGGQGTGAFKAQVVSRLRRGGVR